MGDLDARLRREAFALGVDFFGVADLAPARDAISMQGGDLVAQFPRALSIGVAMPTTIVDQLVRQDDKRVLIAYRSHSYDILNIRLNQVSSRLAGFLQREGCRAFPIAAAERGDGESMYGLFSHKLAAHLAGLGWIGKSCLLITQEAGPRVRWASVLTTAPLLPTGKPLKERCGNCSECVDICPPRAFTGRPYRDGEHRDLRFDVHKCDAYFEQLKQEMVVPVCGMCLYVCPYGRNRN